VIEDAFLRGRETREVACTGHRKEGDFAAGPPSAHGAFDFGVLDVLGGDNGAAVPQLHGIVTGMALMV